MGFLPILNGQYDDFTAGFYSNVGVTLCFSAFLGIFTPHASYFFYAGMNVFGRFTDRGCRRGDWESIKRTEEEIEADPHKIDVHTQQLIQDDLNAVYTGEEIYSHYVYSSLYGYMLIALTFCAGMPVLIPLSAVFYLVFYLIYKCLLVKYYARATTFNEGLPIDSAKVSFPLAVILHLFFGSLMVSNAQIFGAQGNTFPTLKNSGQEFFVYLFSRYNDTQTGTIFFWVGLIVLILVIMIACSNSLLRDCTRQCCKGLETALFCKCGSEELVEVDSNNFYAELTPEYLQKMLTEATLVRDNFKRDLNLNVGDMKASGT